MPYSSDQLRDVSKLSSTGQKIIQSRDLIIARWLTQVRTEVSAAKDLPEPLLVDTLPAFLDNLAEALSPDYPRGTATEGTTLAQEHGSERARLSAYNPAQIIKEYQVLREVIIAILTEESELSREEMAIIRRSFDEGIREAVMGFAVINNEIREQFIATLTHDLRNPIGIIQMAADLLSDEASLAPDGKDLLDIVAKNAKRADQMIVELLNSAAIKSGRPLNFELKECDILKKAQLVAKHMSTVHGNRFKVFGNNVTGHWDCDALERVLENLCSNAVKYGETEKPITLDVKATHGRAILSVHNHGPEIPASEQEAIFQVFKRTREARSGNKRGWGLGLALVRGFCEGHAGSVAIDSSSDRGTTFLIDIPLDPRPFLKDHG